MSTAGGRLVSQGLVDPVGDPPLQAPEGVGCGPSLGELALVVGAAFRIAGDLGQGDVVHDPVELAVAAAVEPVAVGTPRAGRQRRGPVAHGELGLGPIAADVTDLGQQLGFGDGSDAADLRQGGVEPLAQPGDLGGELGDLGVQLPQAGQALAGDPGAGAGVVGQQPSCSIHRGGVASLGRRRW